MNMDEKRISRRAFLQGAAVFAGAATLAACAQPAPAPSQAPTQAPEAAQAVSTPVAAAAEPVTLEVWEQEVSIKAALPPTDLFLKQNPEYKINWVPKPLVDTANGLLAAIAAGSGAPDLAFVQYTDMMKFTLRGGEGITDLTPLMGPRKQEWVPWCLNLVTTKDGKIIGLPTDIGAAATFYRRDTYDKLGKPSDPDSVAKALATWDDFYATGLEVAKLGDTWLIDLASNIFDILRQQGKQGYFDANGQPIVNTDPYIQAATTAQKFRNAGLDMKAMWTPEWNTAMQKGQILTYPIAAWFDIIIHGTAPDTGGNWGVVPLPGGASANMGGSYYLIPALSQKKEQAWKFASFLVATVEGLTPYLAGGRFLPGWTGIYNAKVFTDPDPFYAGQPWLTIFAKIADSVPEIVLNINDPIAGEEVGKALAIILDEGGDPATELNKANENIKNRIAGQ
jgi:ABC-type glycerol-3-phosphate transport system substrate-binding protein